MADVLRPPTHGTSHFPGGIEMERSDQSVYDPTHDFQGKEVWRTGIYMKNDQTRVFMILPMTSRAKNMENRYI